MYKIQGLKKSGKELDLDYSDYNIAKFPTTKTGPTSITNSQNATVSDYYIYRTTNAMLQDVDTKFKLV